MPAFNFKARFADPICRGDKRQTIRKLRVDGRQPARVGDRLTFYTGMRTKNCRRLAAGQCVDIQSITIAGADATMLGGVLQGAEQMGMLARADGFSGVADFLRFFEETHGLPFSGWVIRWIPVADEDG